MWKSTRMGPRESVFAYVLALRSEPESPSPKLEGARRKAEQYPNGPQGICFRLRPGAAFGAPLPVPKTGGGARGRKNTQTGPRESVFAYVLALRSEAGFPSPKLEGGARRRTSAQTGPKGSVFAYVLALHSATTTTTTTQMARAASDRPLEWCLLAHVMGIQGGWGLSTAAMWTSSRLLRRSG